MLQRNVFGLTLLVAISKQYSVVSNQITKINEKGLKSDY